MADSNMVTASDWMKGIGLSVLASMIGGASKLAIRKSWLIQQQDVHHDDRYLPAAAADPTVEDNDHHPHSHYHSPSHSSSSPHRNHMSSAHLDHRSPQYHHNHVRSPSQQVIEEVQAAAAAAGVPLQIEPPASGDETEANFRIIDKITSLNCLDAAAARTDSSSLNDEDYDDNLHSHDDHHHHPDADDHHHQTYDHEAQARASLSAVASGEVGEIMLSGVVTEGRSPARLSNTSPQFNNSSSPSGGRFQQQQQQVASPLSTPNPMQLKFQQQQQQQSPSTLVRPGSSQMLESSPIHHSPGINSLPSNSMIFAGQDLQQPQRSACKVSSTVVAYILRGSGMIGMTLLNPLCCVLAMNYASPSILAPFSGLTLVWIVLFSEKLIGEAPSPTQVTAASLIVLGEVVVAMYGDHENDAGVTVENVRQSYLNPLFLAYFGFMIIWMLLLFCWMRSSCPQLKKFSWGVAGGSITGLQNFLKDSLSLHKATSSSPPPSSTSYVSGYNEADQYQYEELVQSQQEQLEQEQLPWLFPLLILCAMMTAFGGLLLLTACMKRFDVTYSSAMFVGSFVVSATIMSAIHYHTFEHLESAVNYVMYPAGLLLLMVGVFILVQDSSFKSSCVHEEEEQQRQHHQPDEQGQQQHHSNTSVGCCVAEGLTVAVAGNHQQQLQQNTPPEGYVCAPPVPMKAATVTSTSPGLSLPPAIRRDKQQRQLFDSPPAVIANTTSVVTMTTSETLGTPPPPHQHYQQQQLSSPSTAGSTNCFDEPSCSYNAPNVPGVSEDAQSFKIPNGVDTDNILLV